MGFYGTTCDMFMSIQRMYVVVRGMYVYTVWLAMAMAIAIFG